MKWMFIRMTGIIEPGNGAVRIAADVKSILLSNVRYAGCDASARRSIPWYIVHSSARSAVLVALCEHTRSRAAAGNGGCCVAGASCAQNRRSAATTTLRVLRLRGGRLPCARASHEISGHNPYIFTYPLLGLQSSCHYLSLPVSKEDFHY